jgi:membrane protein
MSEPSPLPKTSVAPLKPAKLLTAFKQVIWDTQRHAQEAELPLVASSLAYTTILSIVPALAVSFSIFQAFGGMEKLFEQIEPIILENLAQGAGKEATQALRRYITNAHAGALGAGGILALLITTISMLSSIEKAINRVWRARIDRSWFQRISSYWLLVTLGPVVLGVVVGFVVTFSKAADGVTPFLSADIKKGMHGLVSALTPVVFIVYFLIYRYVPNRVVRFRSALIGALFGTIAWSMAKWGYGIYTKKFVTHNRVYGSMGAIPILLLWIYIQWLVVLYGAALSAAIQKRIDALSDALSTLKSGLTSVLIPGVLLLGAAGLIPFLAYSQEKTLGRVDWYIVRQITPGTGKSTVSAVFSESVEKTGNRYRHQSHTWKKENGLLIEEHLGAFTEVNSSLTPLFAHFSRVEPGSQTRADLTLTTPPAPKPFILSAKVIQGKEELPPIQRELPRDTLFASTFSEWIRQNHTKLTVGKSVQFHSLIEDAWPQAYAPVLATALKLPVQKNSTHPIQVDHNQMRSIWTVDSRGEIIGIDFPKAQIEIRKSDEESARKALGLPIGTHP